MALNWHAFCARALDIVSVNQNGSHVVAELIVSLASHITIPVYKPIKVGTLASMLRDFEEQTGLTRDELLRRL